MRVIRDLIGVSSVTVMTLAHASLALAQDNIASRLASPVGDRSELFKNDAQIADFSTSKAFNRELKIAERSLPSDSSPIEPRLDSSPTEGSSSVDSLDIDNQETDDIETHGLGTDPSLMEGTSIEDSDTFIKITDMLDPPANPLNFPTAPEDVDIEKTQSLTLEQAVELAKRNNGDLQVVRLNLENALLQKREAVAELWPTLTAEVTVNRNASSQLEQNIAAAGLSFSGAGIETTNLNGNLTFNYNIYTGGARGARLRQAERMVRFNELEVEQQTEQIRFDVTTNYYNLQDADAQVAIEQASVEDATQTLRDAQLLEQAGLGTRFDVLRAEVDLANANQALTLAISNQRSARRQLAQTLSLGPGVDITAADEIAEAGTWPYSLDESVVMAYKHRAELEQELVQREINDQQVKIELASVIPQLSFFTTYNFIDNFSDAVGTFDGYTLGAQVQWTFFDGGRAFARAEQSRKQIEIDENNFAIQRNQIRLEVETAYYELIANQENIITAQKSVESATESLRLARLRFQAGVGTQTDVIDSQRDLTDARGNFLQAIIDYNQSLNELQRAVTNVQPSITSNINSSIN